MNIRFYDWCLARARQRLLDARHMPNISKRQIETGVTFEAALEAEARAVVKRIADAQAGKYGRQAQIHAQKMEQIWTQNRATGF